MKHTEIYEKLCNIKSRKAYDFLLLEYIKNINNNYITAVEWFKYNYNTLNDEKKFRYMYKLSYNLNIKYNPINEYV